MIHYISGTTACEWWRGVHSFALFCCWVVVTQWESADDLLTRGLAAIQFLAQQVGLTAHTCCQHGARPTHHLHPLCLFLRHAWRDVSAPLSYPSSISWLHTVGSLTWLQPAADAGMPGWTGTGRSGQRWGRWAFCLLLKQVEAKRVKLWVFWLVLP